ncbi:CD3072 family TudS-related putative desulfidase [Clostridium sp.]|uniref:CD3072 family TudS-related putative desulfidase n=1 Tax=Clostridium sp. TaxID=1506 RepID=UPI003217EACD
MEKKKIVFVSHCVLNTASKVVYNVKKGITEEEIARKNFLCEAIKEDIHIIQLPCPEFNLYGSNRWGHTKEQFDNPFFRDSCRKMLEPYILQIKEYVNSSDKFEVLGIIGIDGSPSCGVNVTCCGEWGGEFSSHDDINGVIQRVHVKKEKGVFIEVLESLLQENGIDMIMVGLTEGVHKIII